MGSAEYHLASALCTIEALPSALCTVEALH